MARYLSPEWIEAFDAALSGLDLSDAVAAAAAGSIVAGLGSFSVAQIVTGVPAEVASGGNVRTVLRVGDGRASFRADPEEHVPADVTIVLSYPDARALAQGRLEPADALARGRVRVRGDLAVLVAGQEVLASAAALLGPALASLTDED
ncbi:MAG TPA: SCP2 sterol-binding domain-containing protein [Acidimicrobiales bacterium]|nr:SCP2 sterol-binding domain-containing protein [Acidimicrobiales bacterium]